MTDISVHERTVDTAALTCRQWQTQPMTIGDETPPLVASALRHSLERGYLDATRSETGRLLATLAATVSGPIADCGTGCGVGAAWLRTGAPATVPVITAELNPDLVGGVRELFSASDVQITCGEWTSLADTGPFSLIFLDREGVDQSGMDAVLALTQVGSLIVIDDFVPQHRTARVDQVRMDVFNEARLSTTEVMVSEDSAVLICARVS